MIMFYIYKLLVSKAKKKSNKLIKIVGVLSFYFLDNINLKKLEIVYCRFLVNLIIVMDVLN